MAIFGFFFNLWRMNDLHTDLVSEFIYTELDLDPFVASAVWLEAGLEITEAGNWVRRFALEGSLARWTVFPRLILLELEHDN